MNSNADPAPERKIMNPNADPEPKRRIMNPNADLEPEHRIIACHDSAQSELVSGTAFTVSSRGIGGSGHGYNSLPQPAGGSAYSQPVDFHHLRFRFRMAPWAPRAPSVSSHHISLPPLETAIDIEPWTRTQNHRVPRLGSKRGCVRDRLHCHYGVQGKPNPTPQPP